MIFLFVLSFIFSPCLSAGEFLGVPVIPGGQTIKKTDARLELSSGLPHEEVLAFYKKALKEFEDIKFRDWKGAIYIEDGGSRPWHSITISKGDEKGAFIIISKDSWSWIIGTLLLRFIGVFVVLIVLFLGMNISGKIISGIVKKMAIKDN